MKKNVVRLWQKYSLLFLQQLNINNLWNHGILAHQKVNWKLYKKFIINIYIKYAYIIILYYICLYIEIEPKEEYLKGIALIKWNNSTMTREVVSFPETNLPIDINERFNELFKAKNKWTVQEITPYIM